MRFSGTNLSIAGRHWRLERDARRGRPGIVTRGSDADAADWAATDWAGILAPLRPAGRWARLIAPPLHVTLGDREVRSFAITAPAGARGLDELRQVVAARFAGLYGEPAHGWTMTADWHARGRFIACALPSQRLDGLRALIHAARHAGLRIGSITPDWARARLTVDARHAGWIGVGMTHGDASEDGVQHTLTLLHLDAGRVLEARTVALPDAPDAAALASLVERLRWSDTTDSAIDAGNVQPLVWRGNAAWLPADVDAGRSRS